MHIEFEVNRSAVGLYAIGYGVCHGILYFRIFAVGAFLAILIVPYGQASVGRRLYRLSITESIGPFNQALGFRAYPDGTTSVSG